MLLGLISRQDPKTLQRHVIAFSPTEVRDGVNDVALQGEDIVRVFDQRKSGLMTNAVDIYVKQIDILDVATNPTSSDSAATATSIAMKQAIYAAVYAVPPDLAANQYTQQAQQNAQATSTNPAAITSTSQAGLPAALAGLPSTALAGLPPGALASLSPAALPPNMATQLGGTVPANGAPQNGTQSPYGQSPYGVQPSYGTPFQYGAQSQYGGQYGVQSPYGGQAAVQNQPGAFDQGSAILQQNNLIQQATAGPFTLDQRTSSQGNVPITAN